MYSYNKTEELVGTWIESILGVDNFEPIPRMDELTTYKSYCDMKAERFPDTTFMFIESGCGIINVTEKSNEHRVEFRIVNKSKNKDFYVEVKSDGDRRYYNDLIAEIKRNHKRNKEPFIYVMANNELSDKNFKYLKEVFYHYTDVYIIRTYKELETIIS